MFHKKPSKKEEEDKGPYTIHWCHYEPITPRCWQSDHHMWLSVDPALEHFAIGIEKRYHNGVIETVQMIKANINSYTTFIDSNQAITPVWNLQDNVPRLRGDMASKAKCRDIYERANQILDSFEVWYDQVHMAVVERLPPQNYQSTRIMQHVISYLTLRLRNRPLRALVIEVDPRLKGAILNFPGIDIKRESEEEAIRLSRERGDKVALDAFLMLQSQRQKCDDFGDVKCQVEALCYLLNLPVTMTKQVVNHYNQVMAGNVNPLNPMNPLSPTIQYDARGLPLSNMRDVSSNVSELVAYAPSVFTIVPSGSQGTGGSSSSSFNNIFAVTSTNYLQQANVQQATSQQTSSQQSNSQQSSTSDCAFNFDC